MTLTRLFLLALAVGGCRTYTVTYTDDGGPCSAPRTVCGGQCVDITTDRNNCGNCGVMCGSNELCLSGGGDGGSTCQSCPSSTDTVCGTGGGSFCVDTTTDDNNCGGCSAACQHGSHCVASHCVCSLTTCGTDCVDLQTDVSHCGSCTNACGTPASNEIELCSAGHCAAQCESPFADCDGLAGNGCEADLLTDPSNCGVCGRSCGSGSVCSLGQCPITTYASTSFAHGLAVDSTYVYFASDASTTGGIYRVPTVGLGDGGAAELLVNVNTTTFVGVDSSYIAWVQTGSVDSRLLSGGSTNTLTATGASIPAFVLAGGYAYYSTIDGKNWRVPEDGSAPATLLSSTGAASAAAVDGSNVYAVFAGEIYTLPITSMNGTPTLFAGKQNANAIAIDASNAYWTTTTGTVVFQPKGTPGMGTLLVTGQMDPGVVATDGVNVYWATIDGAIRRMTIGGLQLLTLATGQGSVSAITVDSTRVYWTGSSGVMGTIK